MDTPRFSLPLHSLLNREEREMAEAGSSRRNADIVDGSKLEESDEDLFTVPDLESGPSSSGKAEVQRSRAGDGPEKNRRGRNQADREYRRLRRLLRNRVSAQQARERKKVYVNELESRVNELDDQNSKLEEKISTLINENNMLRKVLMSSRPKADDSVEYHDKSAKK